MPDVIVLGAGTAGSVVTRRLLDAGLSVTLVEAGGMDTNPAIHDLSRVGELWMGPEDWQWFSAPQPRAMNRRLHLPRGKVVGGSNALNGTIWVRGLAWDYDQWAAAGNTGWDAATVMSYFDRIEKHTPDDAGMVDVVEPELSPIQNSILEAALAYGLPLNKNYNEGDVTGVSRMQQNLRAGRRLSTWAGYVRPVLDHPGLTLLTGTLVERLELTDGRVTGVRVSGPEGNRTLHADRVVVCAGALASPGILLRSGIGPAAELSALGIDVAVDLPGVGKNLQDHFLVPVIFGTQRPVDPPTPFGPVTQTHWFWKSDEALPVPDTQPINFSVPFYYDAEMTGPASGFTLHAGLIRPHSTGSVTLADTAAGSQPVIDYNLFDDERDLRALIASVRQCREVARTAPLAEVWGVQEALPGPDFGDDDASLERWVRRAVNTYHHMTSTCRMGTDPMAVVDPALAVHGVEGLTVADASVMPSITTGNTNAPVAMIGERAAEFVLAD